MSQRKSRFHPSPDDLVSYPRQVPVSRFGQDRGTIVQPMVAEVGDYEGKAVIISRVMDNLDRLRQRAPVTAAMYNAARELEKCWDVAGYSAVKTSNLSDNRGGNTTTADFIEQTRRARDIVKGVQVLLGGEASIKWQAVHGHLLIGKSIASLAGKSGAQRSRWNKILLMALEEMGADYDKRARISKRRKIQKA